ncbi:14113_t:CDS:1, partial [Gigaspora margarita]
ESLEVELIEVESVDVELVDVESVEVELVESMKAESVKVNERTKMKLAIKELDGMLKKDDSKIDKDLRVCLQALLQYLR